MGSFRASLRAVGELVLPRACAGCARLGTWWCERCAVALAARPTGLVLAPDTASTPMTAYAVAPYRGPVGAALVAMKERGTGALLAPLADALARSVVAALDDVGSGAATSRGVVLVPAPSRPAAVRARGADVVADLTRACAARLPVDATVVRGLVHARAVADQATLDAAGRGANLSGALRVRPVAAPLLTGRTVVVVDDVVTTGSTLAEAARAVRATVPGVQPGTVLGATVAAAGGFAHAVADRPVVGEST